MQMEVVGIPRNCPIGFERVDQPQEGRCLRPYSLVEEISTRPENLHERVSIAWLEQSHMEVSDCTIGSS